MVERRRRKPCWCSAGWKAAVREGRMSRSSILTAGARREIGRYETPLSADFPGFNTGMILAVFQIAGTSAFATDKLKVSVKY